MPSNGLSSVATRAAIAVAIATVLPGTVPAPAHGQDAPRGAALLGQARTAIGGEQRLAGVRTLQVTGTFRRVVGGNDTEGDFEVFIELPGNYLRSEKTGTPGQPSTETIEALVGTEVRDVVRGGGGGRRGVSTGGDGFPPEDFGDNPDAERRGEGQDDGGQSEGGQDDVPPGEAGAVPGPPADSAQGRGRGRGPDLGAQRWARQADVSRLLLMWLLRSEMPLAWVGVAESPDGKADVLEARYADGRPTRLFLESGTHMPLMMQWEAAPVRGGDAPDGAGARRGGPPPIVTFEMTFFDHRAVNGIQLPYVITRGADGQTTERWAISRYRVNQSFPAETFTR